MNAPGMNPTETTRPAVVKPELPPSPLPALLDHDGRFQALYPEDLVVAHGEAMIAFERARILALLDAFGEQCRAWRSARLATPTRLSSTPSSTPCVCCKRRSTPHDCLSGTAG